MKQLIKKPAFWLIAILVFAVINVVFADHIGRFFVRPTNDATQVFVVMDKDGNPIFEVNTSTDGAAVTGVLSVSGAITATGGVTGTNFDIATTNITAGSGFWDDCPSQASNDMSKAFFYTEDFIGVEYDTTYGATGADASIEGWLTVADDGHAITSAAGTLGGIIGLTPVTGSNNQVSMQLGELNTESFVEFTAASGKEVWVEFNVATDDITASAAIWFVGLADEAANAADFLDDDGIDFGDDDYVGFSIFEANEDTLCFTYGQTGTGPVMDTLQLVVATTFYTLGIHFDGATTITYYVDGTAAGTVLTTATGFPDTEELSPIIAIKNGAQDRVLSIDWIKLVSER